MQNTKFFNNLENKVKQTIKKYKLLNKKDKILVAASGGKDSTVVLYLLKKFGYKVEALHSNNYVQLYGNFPEQKQEMLDEIDNFLALPLKERKRVYEKPGVI